MIFYFTATGNSLQAAGKLASELHTELVSITEAITKNNYKFTISEGESVGFVFPVYFFGIPTIIKDFVSRLVLEGEKSPYLYAVLNCGATTGKAARMFETLLTSRGYRLSATYSVAMVDNYVLLYSVVEKEKQVKTLEKAEITLEEIITKIGNKDCGDYDGLKGRAAGLVTKVAYPLYRYGRKTKKFYADEKCTRCGLCQRICPIGAIKVTKEGPVWPKKQCIHCLGCIHRCPVEAIQYGKSTAKRGRYVNAKVKLPV